MLLEREIRRKDGGSREQSESCIGQLRRRRRLGEEAY